ncbi:MAG: LysM peptidoglycan-binding domain-containing protein [Myxococcales bacterium]|nr:LysM peptidoglycan-binding domain-containing protein [Myxococcales bacterium]
MDSREIVMVPRCSPRLLGWLVLGALALPAWAPAEPFPALHDDGPRVGAPASNPFEVPEALASRVRFWRDVYSRYDSNSIVIHDLENFDVIYAVINESAVLGGMSRAERERFLEAEKARINASLQRLASSEARLADLSPEDLEIYKLIRKYDGWRDFVGRLRAQDGLADRFREAVQLSGTYFQQIEEIFASYGVPVELARLCFVESLFRFRATSKVGAAGLWQFMRSTGRDYLRIDHLVDERLDPIASTHAAAKLLRLNYETLGSWPVAITAYNHGRGGMARAIETLGTSDIVRIIHDYDGRAFGFASKNFYAEFLAAMEIVGAPERFFGPIERAEPLRPDTFVLPDSVYLEDLVRYTGVDRETLSALNPALLPSVVSGDFSIPSGYRLRLPRGTVEAFAATYAGKIPADRRFAKVARRATRHVVRRGDTLSDISRLYGVSLQDLRSANSLRSDRILAGKSLWIPQAASAKHAKAPARASSASAVPAAGGYILHRVDRGDTLGKISQSYRVSPTRIREVNGLSGDHIRVGQFLKIPRI